MSDGSRRGVRSLRGLRAAGGLSRGRWSDAAASRRVSGHLARGAGWATV